MRRSHQRGTIAVENGHWVGFYNQKVVDPTTGATKWRKRRVALGAKSSLTKYEAREKLEAVIAECNGHGADAVPDVVSLKSFVRERYFPLREGGTWKEETAKVKKLQIERDILDKFGDLSLHAIDKFMLQTHLNDLAQRLSSDRVKQARSYMRSIMEEAVDQGYLEKDPARKLIVPNTLRAKDKSVLTWEQLKAVLDELEPQYKLLVRLDMTGALRPSELFALRWKSWDGGNTLRLSETAYKGKIRPWGKTQRSLSDIHIPDALAADLQQWKDQCEDTAPDAFIFPNRDGGFIDTKNFRQRVLKKVGKEVNVPKLNFQVIRRSIATLAQKQGSVKDIQSHLRHTKADTTANVYMQEIPASVQSMVDWIDGNLVGGQSDV